MPLKNSLKKIMTFLSLYLSNKSLNKSTLCSLEPLLKKINRIKKNVLIKVSRTCNNFIGYQSIIWPSNQYNIMVPSQEGLNQMAFAPPSLPSKPDIIES